MEYGKFLKGSPVSSPASKGSVLTVPFPREGRQWLATDETAEEITQFVHSCYLEWNPRITQEYPILAKFNEVDFMEADHDTIVNAIRALSTPKDAMVRDASAQDECVARDEDVPANELIEVLDTSYQDSLLDHPQILAELLLLY
ncbi:hypothetical protein DM02DRAFT_629887 [Periconia macrospinosa]|uniref:Uncharacterized protein n=1 Tax=Periconia macrospinosa TaxID=97972 RepID=A0A2V1DL32_9PLEO|nr:hypothetical protein DM02DRAFT_629887 [Periconia macrospinosa]